MISRTNESETILESFVLATVTSVRLASSSQGYKVQQVHCAEEGELHISL